jgi:hypothetical protein
LVWVELGSVSSVFGEVHRAAFDVFVFVSKRLGTGDQPGVYGFKRVPIIHDVILAGGFVNALMMSASSEPVDVGRCPSIAHRTVSAPRCTSSLSGVCAEGTDAGGSRFCASIRCARSTHQALRWLSSDRDYRPDPLS